MSLINSFKQGISKMKKSGKKAAIIGSTALALGGAMQSCNDTDVQKEQIRIEQTNTDKTTKQHENKEKVSKNLVLEQAKQFKESLGKHMGKTIIYTEVVPLDDSDEGYEFDRRVYYTQADFDKDEKDLVERGLKFENTKKTPLTKEIANNVLEDEGMRYMQTKWTDEDGKSTVSTTQQAQASSYLLENTF